MSRSSSVFNVVCWLANRFFGVLQTCVEPGRSNGRIKMRGIKAYLPKVVKLWQDRLDELRSGRVPLEQLLITQKLSRELEQYTAPSPPVRAVVQLQSAGKEVKVGQYVRFLYTIGEPGVHARVVLLSSGCLNQGDIIQAHHHCITKRTFCFG